MGRAVVNRTLRGVVGAAVALVLLGACSASVSVGTGSGQLDTDKAEDSTRGLLEGVPVDSVTCPDRDLKEGDVFECTAEVDGQAARVEVTQKDDEGNVHLEQVDAILDMAKAVAFIEAQVLESSGSAFRLRSPDLPGQGARIGGAVRDHAGRRGSQQWRDPRRQGCGGNCQPA